MPDQNSSHDSAIGWIILFGIFLCLFALFWYFFEFEIKNLYRWIRWSEMWLASRFVGEDYIVQIGQTPYVMGDVLEETKNLYPEELNSDNLRIISMLALSPFRLAMAIIISMMGIWCMMSGPGTQYRRKFNLDGLIAMQANTFPVISPFIKFNPSNQPPRPPGSPVPAKLPAFAEALGPEEWIAYNQIPIPDGEIDENVAYKAFAKQLGPRWRGVKYLKPYKQILLAAFCLKASRKRNEADAMLGELAKCWEQTSGLNLNKNKKLLKEARNILKNQKLSGSVIKRCNHHGFENTALLGALETARSEGGVLAPSQFVWLRAYDRTLWYPLNNLGRQSFHMEALGAMSHFKAEKRTARPIPMPKIADAVESISEYIKSPRSRPIPQLSYAGVKRGGVKKAKKK